MTSKALKHLSKDTVLKKLINKYPPFDWPKTGDIFTDLVESIINQQLSLASAASIYARFKKLFKNSITPKNTLKLTIKQLKSVGLSKQKSSSIQNVATAIISGSINIKNLHKLKDQQIKFTFNIAYGNIPPGMNFNNVGNNAVLSGTPTTAGNFAFIVRVSDGEDSFSWPIAVVVQADGDHDGIANVNEAPAMVYPTDAARQTAMGIAGMRLGSTINGKGSTKVDWTVEYSMNTQFVLGNRFHYEETVNYQQLGAMFYLRYDFDKKALPTRFPPNPIRPYYVTTQGGAGLN